MALAAPPPSLISCELQTEHQSFHRMLTIEVLMLFCALFIALLASCTTGYSVQNRQSGTYGYGSEALLLSLGNSIKRSKLWLSLADSLLSLGNSIKRSKLLLSLADSLPIRYLSDLAAKYYSTRVGLITLLTSFSTRTIHLIRRIISKLSIPFITYTLTFSDDANNTASPFFILSAVFLHLLFDAIDTKSDKGILVNYNDLEERKQFPMQQITNIGWLIFILTGSSAGQNIPLELKLPTCAVLGVRVVKAIVLYMALRPASRSFAMGKNAKLVASYMDQLELEDSQSQLPSASELLECCSEAEFMSEYKYLVSGEEKQMIEPCQEKGYRITLTDHSELITLDKVWACEGVDHEQKELCLSFALFKLLRRKLEGLPLAESGSPTALRLLLHDHGPFQDQERAFRIVKLQLAFVRDYLFSTVPLTSDFFPFLQSFLPTGYLILISIVIDKLARPSSFLSTYYQSLINEQSTENVELLFDLEGVLLLVVLLILYYIEAGEYLHNCASNWGVVARLCQFVKHSQCNRLRPTVQLQTAGSSPSSVLHRKFITDNKFVISYSKLMIANIGLNQHSLLKWTWKRFLPKVPEEVKNAILRSLKDSNGRLSNGTGSLDRNGAGTREFHAACCLHSHTERILAWHIATSHCELHEANFHEANLQAASCLSRYCAYLVTRLPELIPEDSDWTKLIVGGVVEQVCRRNHGHSFHIGGWCFCWDCRTFRRKPHADEEEEEDEEEGESKRALQLVKMGEQLGELLRTEISDGSQRWKILADLWAEKLIYIAPSDNVEAYTKCLGKDGQFIIHVWALLSNIGINDRPPA